MNPQFCSAGSYLPGSIVAVHTITPPSRLMANATNSGKCYKNTYKQKMSFGTSFNAVYALALCNTQADGYVCYTVCAPAYCYWYLCFGLYRCLCSVNAASCTRCVATPCLAGYCNCFINLTFGCLKDLGANPTSPYIVETELKIPSLYTGCTTGWIFPSVPDVSWCAPDGVCGGCCCCTITAMPIGFGCSTLYYLLPTYAYSCCCTGTYGCYERCVIMESNTTSFNNFPSVVSYIKECLGGSGGLVLSTVPLQNRLWCCSFAQGANPAGWLNNWFPIKALRSCGTITNNSGSTLTVTLYAQARDCNYNYCYCSLACCSLGNGGYWNYDVTFCNFMQAAACYQYGCYPLGGNGFYICITPYSSCQCAIEVCSHYSWCVHRNNDLYVGTGYGTL